MERHLDDKHIRDDFPVTERQAAYSLDRLTAVVNELSRLIETRPSSVIERVLADLDNGVDYTSIGIEAVHKLRLWRANARWLVAELDAATRSIHLAEQHLGRRIDAALATWEQRFEVAGPGTTGRPAVTIGPRPAPGSSPPGTGPGAASHHAGGCFSGAAGIATRTSAGTPASSVFGRP